MGTDELVGAMFLVSMILVVIKVLGNSDDDTILNHDYKEMPQDDNLNHI